MHHAMVTQLTRLLEALSTLGTLVVTSLAVNTHVRQEFHQGSALVSLADLAGEQAYV